MICRAGIFAAALLAVAVRFAVPSATADPITVPIVIAGGGSVSLTCTFTSPLLPGEVIVTIVFDDPANNGADVIFALSGQDASQFAVRGNQVIVGGNTLIADQAPVTFHLSVQTIPPVNFTATCGT